jgi:hypothetical protein
MHSASAPESAIEETHVGDPQDENGAVFEPEDAEPQNDDVAAKVATIAVVGVGVALISAELLPGMLIGVAAAFLPGIGKHMRPLLKRTVKAGYTAVKKTREFVAEAGEQMQDMLAEAKAEDVPPVPPPPANSAQVTDTAPRS